MEACVRVTPRPFWNALFFGLDIFPPVSADLGWNQRTNSGLFPQSPTLFSPHGPTVFSSSL